MNKNRKKYHVYVNKKWHFVSLTDEELLEMNIPNIPTINDIEEIIFSYTEYKIDKLMRINIAETIYNRLVNTIIND